MPRVLRFAVLLCATALAVSSDDAPKVPSSKPKLEPEKRSPRLGVLSAAAGLSKLSPAGSLAKYYTTIAPYLKNPMALPKKVLGSLALMLVAMYYVLSALTSLPSLLSSPSSNVMNLCIGTALFHTAMFVMRGPEQHLRRLTTPERLPYTMSTGLSFVVALKASLDKDRIFSYVFGAFHLFAFFLDAASHIPYGGTVVKYLLSW